MENCVCTSVSFTPGKRTLRNFLAAAMQPVGTVLYIYGGGWNLEDTGGNRQSEQIGLAPEWVQFFKEQDASFSYRGNYYPADGRNIYGWAGLDCSGYVGWAVYNTMNTGNGGRPYVVRATQMAQKYAQRYGWGSFAGTERPREAAHWKAGYESGNYGRKIPQDENSAAQILRPGDIFSMEGHVWICVGMCSDGSAVILHSTPSESICGCPGGGVQLSALGRSKECEAYCIADGYMGTYYPEWSRRYRAVLKDFDTYTGCQYAAHEKIHPDQGSRVPGGRFRWYLDSRGLLDPDGIAGMDAAQVLMLLVGRMPASEMVGISSIR